MATCPHCQKIIIVMLGKDNGKQPSAPKPANGGDTSDLEELLDMIDDAVLVGAAVDFVSQTRERFGKYKEKTRMSDKQMSWLRKLASGDTEESW